ncbi:MAG: hypothetical protein AAFP90_14700, partial [Planctomycetota bacterium]
ISLACGEGRRRIMGRLIRIKTGIVHGRRGGKEKIAERALRSIGLGESSGMRNADGTTPMLL